MELKLRRVVTGHDAKGRAKVLIASRFRTCSRRAPAPPIA